MSALSRFDDLPRWVLWRSEPRLDDPSKLTKVPYQPNGRKASSTAPTTWVARAKAESAVERIVNGHDGGGIGIVLGEIAGNDMLAGVDLDTCRGDDETFEPWAREIIERFATYAEISPSGKGAKLFFRVGIEDFEAIKNLLNSSRTGRQFKKSGGGDHPPGFEIYFLGRYFAVTERHLAGTPDALATVGVDDLRWLLAEAGPALAGNGSGQKGAKRGSAPNDQSRSGAAFRLGLRMRRAGKSFEEFCEACRSNTDGEIADWYREKGAVDDGRELSNIWVNIEKYLKGITLDDFFAYMLQHNYIFAPTGEVWPAASVNARIPPVPLVDEDGRPIVDKKGEPVRILASNWLDKNRPVEQMTWVPGMPELIEDRLTSHAGWIEREGARVFNLYRGPAIVRGNANLAIPWIRHLRRVFPAEHRHLARFLAHRLQRPGDKINHALVLGGAQGIGKDSLLEPVKQGVGPWNWHDISPKDFAATFNGFAKSVVLRINEGHDLGDINRYQFYEHTKSYIAAPPDVLRVNEKHLREYYVHNVCGVIITTNHKTDGIYLPPDDRRHFVAWSNLAKEELETEYWDRLWRWYYGGGFGHVAAHLAQLDISDFDPKAPPPKTDAWWAIVDAGRPSEDADLASVLDKLKNPDAFILDDLVEAAFPAFADWLRDRKNRRVIPHRLETVGYGPVRNPDAKSGLWVIAGERQVCYARANLTTREQLSAVAVRRRAD
jgi:hypothetical protein